MGVVVINAIAAPNGGRSYAVGASPVKDWLAVKSVVDTAVNGDLYMTVTFLPGHAGV